MMKMHMFKKIMAVSVLSLSACAFADLKVGIVSVQGVFQGAPQGQAAVQQLKQTLGPQMAKLSGEQSAFETAVSNFNRNAPTLSVSDKTAQEQALTAQQQQIQQDVAAFRKTEDAAQQKAAGIFQNDLVNAVSQVAQQGNYDMILTDQAVPFYKDSFDVTAQVAAIMSKMSS